MRLPCPFCGERDIREFRYRGSDTYLHRPPPGADTDAWEDYLHLRENPAGFVRDLWYHAAGCGAWLVVERDTVSHAVFGARPASEASA